MWARTADVVSKKANMAPEMLNKYRTIAKEYADLADLLAGEVEILMPGDDDLCGIDDN